MPRPLTTTLWSALFLAAVTLLAAFLLPRPWQIDIGAPGDSYYLSGAFPAEDASTTLRWTGARSELALYGAFDGRLLLTMHLFREPAISEPWLLQLSDADSAPKTFAAFAGWRTYHVLLPADAERRLTLSSPTFQPGPTDPRELGVAIDAIGLEPLRSSPPLVFGLARWVYLLATGVVFGCAVGVAAAWLQAGRTVDGGAHRIARIRRRMTSTALGATMLSLFALAAWAWLHPPSLDWMLPSHWSALALVGGTLLVAALLIPSGLSRRFHTYLAGLQAFRGIATLVVWVVAHVVLLAPLPPEWRALAALVILATPGALAALALFANEPDPLERTLLAIAGAFAVAALLVLALHALPGPLAWWLLLLAADLLALGGALALRRNARRPMPGPSMPATHATPATPTLYGHSALSPFKTPPMASLCPSRAGSPLSCYLPLPYAYRTLATASFRATKPMCCCSRAVSCTANPTA